eukprot:15423797-Alexandrium_andersonii.AAC.1
MSASLVGSEMCIRDSLHAVLPYAIDCVCRRSAPPGPRTATWTYSSSPPRASTASMSTPAPPS